MVKLTINGREIEASPDKTILQICREHNLDEIPTLCYDEKLPPFGSCFLCVVEVEGQSRLFPACSTKPAEGMVISTRSEKVRSARKTCLELLLSDHYADCFGPCRLRCPADVDIQGYMSLVHLGKNHEAVALIKEKNPLPSVCGRVCTRKCELNCRRAMIDTPVGIDFIKRYAADKDMEGPMWQPEVKPDNGVSVGIVGGGPAGLTAAYYLVLEGYRPTIYESLPHLGGMLRYGIPEYRLPKEVLDKEINWICDLGVEVETNKALGKDFSIDDLFKKGHKAVFIGLGAQAGKPMQVENEDTEGVLSGVEFLRQVEMKTAPDVKGRVVVVGGGNTAIDAARTSLRLGADEVVLLYRRTRKEMPANEMEIVAAEEEGVKMHFLAAPVRVLERNGRFAALECIRMELGEPDSSGRRRPVRIEDSEYQLDADWAISAIGQEPNLDGVEGDQAIQTTRWKTIEAKDKAFDTDRPGVFAGGDVVTGPADAIDAIAAGRIAARAIDKYIKTGIAEPLTDRFESRRDNFHEMTAEDIPEIQPSKRHGMPEIKAASRVKTFEEVETGYTTEQATVEAARCAECGCDVALSCQLQDYCTEYGVDQNRFIGAFNRYKVDTRHPFIKIDSNKCIRCGRCVHTCSEILNVSALGFVNRGFKTIVKPALDKALHETNCVACGNCIDVCPTGALAEKMPFRRSGPWKMESVFNVCNYCSVGCNITLNVKTSDLFFVTGAPPDAEPNNGELCVRGRFGYQHYLDGSRLTKPMVRKGDQLVDATWDKAFEAVTRGLEGVIDAHGKDSVILSASPKLTSEELYLAGRLGRVALENNNLMSFHQLTNGADYHALNEILGATLSTVDQSDLENADLIICLGGNPSVDNPVLGWRLKRALKARAQGIVINSAEIDLTGYASVWADARRGSSATLLRGIMAELARTGSVDKDFIAKNTTGYDQFKTELAGTELDEVSSVTGVSVDKIKHMVGLLSDRSKKIVGFYNLESRRDRAPGDLKSLAMLLMMLGKVGRPGSGLAITTNQSNSIGARLAGFDSRLLPGGSTINDAGLKELAALWHTDLSALTNGSGLNLQRKMREKSIRAAIILGENPAADADYNGFVDTLDFLVVGDLFKTETVQMADVFLPLSSYLETEGHFTNWAGRTQSINPIGTPINGMLTFEIINRLSACLSRPVGYANLEEIQGEIDFLHSQIGVPQLQSDRFPTADGKARFISYPVSVATTSSSSTITLEIDARMADRLKSINA